MSPARPFAQALSQVGHAAGPRSTNVQGSSPVGSVVCTVGYNGTCPQLRPSISSTPSQICIYGAVDCPYPQAARVTFTVNATGLNVSGPPSLQVIFVVETTLYDGIYDPLTGDDGGDPCGGTCNESNAVPFFVQNAGRIATGIADRFGANLASCAAGAQNIACFAMVDYFSTEGQDHDDGDGSEYHVDISSFTPAASFGNAVNSTFQAVQLGGGWTISDADFSDNFLSSSSVTALFGAEQGTGFAWNANYEHVIVWMGSTVPRDPTYVSNYNVTYNDYTNGSGPSPSSSCEPSYFPHQPACYGWAEASNSVAAYAKANNIVIDTIDLADGMTMADSEDYRNNGSTTQADVRNILQAGCDMAVATGGSWEGPSSSTAGISFSCAAAPAGSGGEGNLTCIDGSSCEARGAEENPNRTWASNPSLGWALTNFAVPVSLLYTNVTAKGTTGDTFNFIPAPYFEIDPSDPGWAVNCSLGPSSPPLPGACSAVPNFLNLGPNAGVGWAWPDNTMYLGDKWQVSFNVVAEPSFPTADLNIPVILDACVGSPVNPWSSACTPFPGGTSVDYASVEYDPYNTPTTPLSPAQSFPPAWVTVHEGPPPTVQVASTPDEGVAPLHVDLTAVVQGANGTTYGWWDLGGYGDLEQENATFVYNVPGYYTATFELSRSMLGTPFLTASVGILVVAALQGYLNISAGDGESQIGNGSEIPNWSTVEVQGASSGGLTPVQTAWTLNGTVVHPSSGTWNMSNLSTGNYSVKVHYFDPLGESVWRNITFGVFGPPPSHPPPPPLEVVASANRTSVPVGGWVLFTATVETDPWPYTFTWNVDGTNLSENSSGLAVQFTTIGTFPVLAWVVDPGSLNYSTNVVRVNVSALAAPPHTVPSLPPKPTAPSGWLPMAPTSVGVAIGLSLSLVVVGAIWLELLRRHRSEPLPGPGDGLTGSARTTMGRPQLGPR